MNALPRIVARLTFLRCLALLAFMPGGASSSLAAKTYSDNGDGTVTDPTTGLIWMRCSMGQTWTGTKCYEAAARYTFPQASALTGKVVFGGQSDWRLPSVRELLTIVDRTISIDSTKPSPSIDSTNFSLTPPSRYWTSTSSNTWSSYHWTVDFFNGEPNYHFGSLANTNSYFVRMVRGGESAVSFLKLDRSSTDFVDHGDGTISHVATNLMWQRCAIGQIWDGLFCNGYKANSYSWEEAKGLKSTLADYTDWRLPTVDELLGLISYNGLSLIPFTNYPQASYHYWSGSSYSDGSTDAWYVRFDDGEASHVPTIRLSNDTLFTFYVRLVRKDNQQPTTPITTPTTTPVTFNLVQGWNLLGHSIISSQNVATTFCASSQVTSVWKWVPDKGKWAFFSPSLIGQALTDYASNKGYDVLTTINSGDGFWVNAKTAFTMQLPANICY